MGELTPAVLAARFGSGRVAGTMARMRLLPVITFAIALLAASSGCTPSGTGGQTTPPAPGSPSIATDSTAAPTSSRVADPAAFLAELRTARVPVSKSGEPELAIGRGVCTQASRSVDDIASELSASVPVWSREQARIVVVAARGHLC